MYEYEPAGNGSCTAQEGCTGLISSGTSPQESAFLDASENGDDAFFVTAQPLVAPTATPTSISTTRASAPTNHHV